MKILLFANTDWYLYRFRQAQAHFLRGRGAELLLLSPPGEYAPRLQAAGYRWLPVRLERSSMNPARELAALFQLVRLYRAEQPDLVHHFTIKAVLYGSLAARLVGIPRVVNGVTGLGYAFGQGGPFRKILRFVVTRWYRLALAGTQSVFDNNEDRQFFIREGMAAPDAAHVVRSAGVDLTAYAPRPEPSGTPLAVYAGRMLWDKGLGELVEAARRLREQNVPLRVALVGRPDPGNPASISAGQLQAWHDQGLVEYWGWRTDMAEVYNQAHIFCLPSYREGLPTTIIEAAACGRPVVAADVPGCRDAVRHGETGLLVPVRDPAALADALGRLARDANMRREMGRAGRRMAVEDFSTDRVNRDTLAVYARAGLEGW
jgi:glycosyltransferase involved in cell wall biosynthesis